MSNHSPRNQKGIRVTLTFGTNSDAALVRALSKLRPYGRAKLIRKLVREGLRSRLQALGIYEGAATPGPDFASETGDSQGAPPPESVATSASAYSEAPGDTESLVDQLGKTVY
jgi:hypothetical protein